MRPELSSPARFRIQGGSPERDRGGQRTKEILVSNIGYPMCALDNCKICQKICYSAATLQAHMMFHIRKDATNQIFYKCDQCTITFKVKKNKFR